MLTRKRQRLEHYCYSSNGAYFITICTKDKKCILSKITVGNGVLDIPQIKLSKYGQTVDSVIVNINKFYNDVQISHYVIMPNHVHLMIEVSSNSGTSGTPLPTKDRANEIIPQVVSTLKRFINKEIGDNIWQSSYHDHVIRNEKTYNELLKYIDENPIKWHLDCYYT